MTIEDTIKYFDLVISDIDSPSLFWISDILDDDKYSEIKSNEKYIGLTRHSIIEFGINNGYFNPSIRKGGTGSSLTSLGLKLKKFGKGHEAFEKYLEDKSKPQTNNINFIGGNNYGVQSSNSDFIKPTIQNKVNKTANEPSKKSPIEMLSWIIGIIVGLILIYEFIVKSSG